MKHILASILGLLVLGIATANYAHNGHFYLNWQTIDNSKYPDIKATFAMTDPNYRIVIATDIDTSTSFIDSASNDVLNHAILLPTTASTVQDTRIDTTLNNVNVVVNNGLGLMVMIDNSASAKLAYGTGCTNLKGLLHSMLNVLHFPQDYVTIQLFNADGLSIGLSKANDYTTISNYIDNIDNVIGNGNFTEHGYMQAIINPTNGFKGFYHSFDTSAHVGHYHGLIVSGSTPEHPFIDQANDQWGGEGDQAYSDLHEWINLCGLLYIADPATNAFWTDNFPHGITATKPYEDSDTGTYKLLFFYGGWVRPMEYYPLEKNGHQRWEYYQNNSASFFSTLWYNFQNDAYKYQASDIQHQATFTVPEMPTENTVLVQNAQYGINDTLHIMNIALDVKSNPDQTITTNVYPNPASHYLLFDSGLTHTPFNLVDIDGRVVASGLIGQVFSVENVAQGTYQVIVQGHRISRVVIVH